MFEKATDEELVERIARCWITRARLELDLAACTDTATELIDELVTRNHPYPAGASIAAALRLWLDDPEAQRWHQQDLELGREAERLLREWKGENDDATDGAD